MYLGIENDFLNPCGVFSFWTLSVSLGKTPPTLRPHPDVGGPADSQLVVGFQLQKSPRRTPQRGELAVGGTAQERNPGAPAPGPAPETPGSRRSSGVGGRAPVLETPGGCRPKVQGVGRQKNRKVEEINWK